MAKKTAKTKPAVRQRCAQCGYYKLGCRCVKTPKDKKPKADMPTFKVLDRLGAVDPDVKPVHGYIRFGTGQWYIDVLARGDKLFLRGSDMLVIEPDGGNTVCVRTTADENERIINAAQHLVAVAKENRKFWRKKGKQPKR